ncbi:hypothetical protein [Stygiolobus azoricus]|uniref:Uncharacterized protein n=1 Tax=Stygiolobus azoricus TaxID=41675 RepID=A0A650CPA4_9CREN|nr:hypothetical protein [Stygiolobus azoricus]QGR19676.1 hypothetical protein D1868_06480 [Stygiolobus azoricus]
MKQLAIKLLEIAEVEKDPAIKLSALLECIENLVEVDDSEPDFKKKVLDTIRQDKELYEIYERIIDGMFDLIITGSVTEIDSLVTAVKKRVSVVEGKSL